MEYLYHSSGYMQTELKPGILHTGKKVEWDGTESNEWLYASTSRSDSIEQGFASAIEKRWQLDRFQTKGDSIVIHVTGKVPTRKELERLEVYLYTLKNLSSDKWSKVNNKHNQLDTEYKTKTIVRSSSIDKVEKVDLEKWLESKTLKVIASTPTSHHW